MIRIAVTVETFDAIAETLPCRNVAYEPQFDAQGRCLLWVEAAVADKLRALCGPGESVSDVILRLFDSYFQGPPHISA
jgi:hypothetical protein